MRDVQIAIMNDCDEWRPPSVSSKHAISDPTASAAIRRVDEIDGRLAALRAEEAELIDLIGETLAIIQAVRDGLGDKYADVLEWRFIDCVAWACIHDEHGLAKQTGRDRISVAFDWIDSIGITRILADDLEI